MRENSIFLVSVKSTLVCHAPTLAVLGSTTHYRMFCWADIIVDVHSKISKISATKLVAGVFNYTLPG